MKKLFSIISAGLIGLMAVSCIQEKLATFDPTNATAPILGTVEVGAKNVTVTYTPGEFNLGFNEKMAPTHTLALVAADGKAVSKIITSKDSGYSLTATNVNISKALAFFGYADGDVVSSLDFVVRASIQDPTKDNGRNGFVDSQTYTLTNFTVTLPQGSPYADYTEPATWSVIGALSAYDMNWNKDLEMWSTADGDKFVAKAVTIKKDDQFKFRKDQGWDTNYGAPGEVEPYVLSVDTELTGAAGGKNLGVAADGIYDLWLDLSGNDAAITITEAYLPYPEHTQASTWSVIGALSNYDINWNGDLAMTSNGKTHVAQGIKLQKDDQFKFRKDAGWDTNFGAPGEVEPFVVNLGSESAAAAGGKNLAVPEDGVYDLILDPDGETFTVVETLGGGVSGIIGGDEPEPEPEPYKGWGIIGDFNGWGGDVAMTEADGVWTGYFTNITKEDGSNGGFKLRKDADWAENVGGTFVALGEPFDAMSDNAPNIEVPAGFYQVVYDTNTQKITISTGEMWSLIGDFNSWGGDVDMVLTDGKWVSPETQLKGGFKIRHNHDWSLSVGGTMTELGVPFDAVSENGPNISVEEGEYIVTYDPTAQTILVETASTPAWSVIGDFNGWGADAVMTQVAPGIWVSDELELTDGGWKLRYNSDWDINRGGGALTQQGEFTAAYPNGDNLTLAGKMRVVFNENNQTIGTLGWGVVGKVASIDGFSWNNDIPMNLAADGKWYSVPVKLSEGDEIKLRWGAGWDTNLGLVKLADTKAEGSGDQSFELQEDGSNFVVTQEGTYMLVLDPTAKLLTLSTDFWSLIGEFNSWAGDVFMLPDGSGKWFAYNQEISGGWKIRKGADWTVSAGGTYAAAGEAFDAVTENGPNIAVTDMTRFDVAYDTAAGKITVSKPVK